MCRTQQANLINKIRLIQKKTMFLSTAMHLAVSPGIVAQKNISLDGERRCNASLDEVDSNWSCAVLPPLRR